MSRRHVAGVRLRGILTSQGEPTVEAQVALECGAVATASCPVAIAPGRRERDRGRVGNLGPLQGSFAEISQQLAGARVETQAAWDETLLALATAHGLGTTATLPLSVAYCKADALAEGVAFHLHLAALAGTRPAMPALLVNIFSGGIHSSGRPDGFQQIMVVADRNSLSLGVADALRVFRRIESRYAGSRNFGGYSASSGLLVSGRRTEALLGELRSELDAVGAGLRIGFDVAAEHLCLPDGRYRFEGTDCSGAALAERIEAYVSRFGVGFVEDPLDPDDEAGWQRLTARLSGRADVVGDDLFATDPGRLRPGLATGIVLKMNQIGTVSSTIAAARRARELGLTCCVSHRSGETEDTSMCDLAVGLGARYIKVGGPRRGDRTARYNQLLRLDEALAAHTPPMSALRRAPVAPAVAPS